jgi:hypothetical protein
MLVGSEVGGTVEGVGRADFCGGIFIVTGGGQRISQEG